MIKAMGVTAKQQEFPQFLVLNKALQKEAEINLLRVAIVVGQFDKVSCHFDPLSFCHFDRREKSCLWDRLRVKAYPVQTVKISRSARNDSRGFKMTARE